MAPEAIDFSEETLRVGIVNRVPSTIPPVHLFSKSLIDELRQSALVRSDREFGVKEVALAHRVTVELSPPHNDNLDVHIHIQIAAAVAQVLSEQLNPNHLTSSALNPSRIAALTFLHGLQKFDEFLKQMHNTSSDQVLDLLGIQPELRSILSQVNTSFARGGEAFRPTELQQCNSLLEARIIYAVETTLDFDLFSNRFGTPSESDIASHISRSARHQVDSWMTPLGIDLGFIQAEAIRQRNQLQTDAHPLVVFDLGGVVMRLDDLPLLHGLSETLGIHLDRLRPALLANKLLSSLQSGAISEAQWVSKLCEELGVAYSESQISECCRIIKDSLSVTYYDDVLALIHELRSAGYPVVALSDTVPSHVQKMQERGIGEYFDALFFSCDRGISKKASDGERAFWIVAATYNRGLEQMVFIDDREDCRNNASKVGITTFSWCENPDDALRAKLLRELRMLVGV